VEVPAKALYDTLQVEYELLPREKNMLSATHRIHHIYRPLSKNIVVTVRADEVEKTDKLVMAYSTNGKYWRSAGGSFANGFVTTHSNVFGFYAVTIDTIAPIITSYFKPKQNAADSISLRFKMVDNFSGIDSYVLRINGKWALAEYDAKNDLLEYFFDENTPKEKLQIELVVTDNKKNQTTFKSEYILDRKSKRD
jgi:hypothetical protein